MGGKFWKVPPRVWQPRFAAVVRSGKFGTLQPPLWWVLPFTAKIFPPNGGKIPPQWGENTTTMGGKLPPRGSHFPPIVVVFSPHMGGKFSDQFEIFKFAKISPHCGGIFPPLWWYFPEVPPRGGTWTPNPKMGDPEVGSRLPVHSLSIF